MTRRRADTSTRDLFAIPRPAPMTPGTMDFRTPVAHLVGNMLKDAHAAGLDRYDVAAQASKLAGREVSKATLDGYTAESREEFNCPLWLAPVLEVVCKSTALAEWHGSVVGGQLMLGAAAIDAEIGRLESVRLSAAEELKKMRELRRRVR
ncbi:hypothetical protein [Pseudoxanthomonas winnipegensis]|uniref:hypothetical protein n=1 Tax=Pseudoxanthomonas winnipegensis TaxID=2480810 RepID=UPI00103C7BF4|nr:hypothetical protein [Pseudoxanthomonas winnipegensis]TBV76840.1 hypothetical protein EYC45_01360 [Pseudoxanthomonas winnipegensis]